MHKVVIKWFIRVWITIVYVLCAYQSLQFLNKPSTPMIILGIFFMSLLTLSYILLAITAYKKDKLKSKGAIK